MKVAPERADGEIEVAHVVAKKRLRESRPRGWENYHRFGDST